MFLSHRTHKAESQSPENQGNKFEFETISFSFTLILGSVWGCKESNLMQPWMDSPAHPKAKRCYGWMYGELEEFISILELPPVTDAQSAVKVGVLYQIKKARK
jgi:hypothetical protein